ncbi:MAG: EamA family transporter [Actinomycetota bacterium]|jgi:DME family drug/metabolite transporter|nr:EamA family transporter [Rubrobacter sp.]MDQ3508166.1 EamA family transporter [Actinomycetota bacterium]
MTAIPNDARERLVGIFLVASAAAIWGTLGLVARVVYGEGVSFEALVLTRAGGAFLVVLAFVILTGKISSLKVRGRELYSLVPLGVVAIGCFYLLYFYTIGESGVGTAAVLLYSSPAFVVIFARIFLKESLTFIRIAALLLTASGIGLVVGAYDLSSLDIRTFVVLTGLGAGLSFAMYSVIGKPLTARLPAHVINCYMLGIGAVVLFIAAIPTLDTLAGLSAGAYVLLVVSALVQTAFAYALYTTGLKRIEAGQASIVATVEVVVAGFVGAVFLAEELTALKILGAFLVISGAVLAQVRLRKSRSVEEGTPPR